MNYFKKYFFIIPALILIPIGVWEFQNQEFIISMLSLLVGTIGSFYLLCNGLFDESLELVL